MENSILKIAALSCLTITSSFALADIEMVKSITANDPAAVIATIGKNLETGESESKSVTLLRHMHDGTDPSTHTIVGVFPDLEALERTMDVRATSKSWAANQRTMSRAMTTNSNALALQRQTWGADSWNEGDYLAAVLLNVPDEAAWIKATDNLNRTSMIKNPGMVRIVRLRGEAASHAVLLASPSYAGLINYMETMEASPEFAAANTGLKNSVVSTVFYQVAKVW